jgi:hypothetical protein
LTDHSGRYVGETGKSMTAGYSDASWRTHQQAHRGGDCDGSAQAPVDRQHALHRNSRLEHDHTITGMVLHAK